MSAPDYRDAACCGNCYFATSVFTRCSKHGTRIDILKICADFATKEQMAVRMGRQGRGCELNDDYFRDGVGYLKLAEEEANMPTLFDFAVVNQ